MQIPAPNGSPRFGFSQSDAINILKNLLLYLVAAILTWGAAYLVPQLEAEGGVWATVAIVVAALLKAGERWMRDTTGSIDGRGGMK